MSKDEGVLALQKEIEDIKLVITKKEQDAQKAMADAEAIALSSRGKDQWELPRSILTAYVISAYQNC